MHAITESLGRSAAAKRDISTRRACKDDVKNEIKRRLPFRDRYRMYFPEKYREHGNSFCAWHEDINHPDLQINDDTHCAYCHRCGLVVDIFDLEARARGLDVKNPRHFKEILSDLAFEAGVDLHSEERRKQIRPVSKDGGEDKIYDYRDEHGRLQYQRVRKKGEKRFVYRRPDGKGGWIYSLYDIDPRTNQKTGKKAVKRLLYRLGRVVRAELNEPILLVEGEKDVHTAESLGFVATTAGSATDWLALVKDNGHSPLKGRKIWLIPDNDDAGEALVEAVRNTLALDADIRVLRLPGLPEKGDLSDFAEYQGPERARQKILHQGPVSDRLTPRLPMGKDFHPDEWGEFIVKNYLIRYFSKRFYQYQNGVYQPVDDLAVENIVASLSDRQFKSQTQYNSVLAAVRRIGSKGISEAEIDPVYILNLKNGIIDMREEDPQLRPHSPTILSTMQLDVAFDLNAKCTLFDQFLADKVPDQSLRQLVWEMIGYLLTPDTGFQVGFFIYGVTATGKSVLAKVITALLGPKRVSYCRLPELGMRFGLSALVGKLVNISSDEEFKSVAPDGVVKALISGDGMMAEQKYLDAFEWRPTARLLVIANQFPATSDVTDAFFRRWIVIPMNVQTSEADRIPNLEKRIIENELPGILNRALHARYRLYKRGRFTTSEESKRFKEEWRSQADPVRHWARRGLVPKQEGFVSLKALFENYRSFLSATNSNLHLRDSEFKRKLEEMGYKFSILDGRNILRGYRLVKDAEKEATEKRAK